MKKLHLLLLAGALSAGAVQAQILYWDTNGATAGAGNPASGTWNAGNTLWSSSSAGDVTTVAYVSGSDVIFSAGSDAATANIAVSGNQTALTLTVAYGALSFTGNQIEGLSNLTIASGASASFSNSIRLNGASNTTLVANGNITGASLVSNGTLTKSGSGTASFTTVDANVTVSGGTMIASGGNKTKAVIVNSGATFRIAGNDTILNSSTVTVNSGGTFELATGVSDTINILTGSGTTSLASASVLTVGGNNGTGTFSGVLSGAGSLAKTGTGTLTLSGDNIHSGNTSVDAGTLTLTDDASLTFYIGANGSNNSVGGTGTFNINGDFVFDLSGAASAGSWTIVDVASLTEVYGATFSIQGFMETSSGIWELGGYTFTESTGLLTAVPEPSTYALLGLGFGALYLLRRKRKA